MGVIIFMSRSVSFDAMEKSKEFITTVICGKDIVPRLGMAQLEYLRSDILQLLKGSNTPKVL